VGRREHLAFHWISFAESYFEHLSSDSYLIAGWFVFVCPWDPASDDGIHGWRGADLEITRCRKSSEAKRLINFLLFGLANCFEGYLWRIKQI